MADSKLLSMRKNIKPDSVIETFILQICTALYDMQGLRCSAVQCSVLVVWVYFSMLFGGDGVYIV